MIGSLVGAVWAPAAIIPAPFGSCATYPSYSFSKGLHYPFTKPNTQGSHPGRLVSVPGFPSPLVRQFLRQHRNVGAIADRWLAGQGPVGGVSDRRSSRCLGGRHQHPALADNESPQRRAGRPAGPAKVVDRGAGPGRGSRLRIRLLGRQRIRPFLARFRLRFSSPAPSLPLPSPCSRLWWPTVSPENWSATPTPSTS